MRRDMTFTRFKISNLLWTRPQPPGWQLSLIIIWLSSWALSASASAIPRGALGPASRAACYRVNDVRGYMDEMAHKLKLFEHKQRGWPETVSDIQSIWSSVSASGGDVATAISRAGDEA